MARSGQTGRELTLDFDRAIVGVLALLVAEREERLNGDKDARKTEVVLSRAGLKADEVAAVMGKKVDAVRKTLQREKN
jgi:DNA-directed RNA polymerase specialized sigma24 family protein